MPQGNKHVLKPFGIPIAIARGAWPTSVVSGVMLQGAPGFVCHCRAMVAWARTGSKIFLNDPPSEV